MLHHSIKIADADSNSGVAHIESVLPYSKADTRPSITIEKTKNERAIQSLTEIFDNIWENSCEPEDAAGSPSSNPPSGTSPINYSKEDDRNEWLVYQAAFLWFDCEPPPIRAHFYQMTRDIEEIKLELHDAIDKGTLNMTRETGSGRFVSREELKKFALSRGEKPKFLFPEER
jgi:hypothetical protein